MFIQELNKSTFSIIFKNDLLNLIPFSSYFRSISEQDQVCQFLGFAGRILDVIQRDKSIPIRLLVEKSDVEAAKIKPGF